VDVLGFALTEFTHRESQTIMGHLNIEAELGVVTSGLMRVNYSLLLAQEAGKHYETACVKCSNGK
jgi:hypothetical protein